MTANLNLLARQFSRADLKQRVTNEFPSRRLGLKKKKKNQSHFLESSLTPVLLIQHEANQSSIKLKS